MSKIDNLIQQYCPEGVEYVKLGELCIKVCSGGTPSRGNGDYFTGTIPWLRTQEVDWKDIYDTEIKITEEAVKNSSAKLIPENCVIIAMYGATAGKAGINKIPLTTNQACCNLQIDSQKALYKYVYYWVCNEYENIKSLGQGSQNNINAQIVKDYPIPLPPLPIQEEIVRILDTFSELQAELQARQLQYQYYRDQLFEFDGRKDIKFKKLGDVATDWYRGAGIKKDEVSEEGIPCIRYGEIHTTYNVWFEKCVSHTDENLQPTKKYAENGDILFAITSEDIPMIGNSVAYLGKDKILVGGDIVVMKHKQNPRYLSYALSTSNAVMQKGKGKVKSKVVHTNVPSLKEIVIPIPSLEEQERIATILDNFDTLVNDLSQGLPAEIEARKQQYEYYRDKLLTFKKKA